MITAIRTLLPVEADAEITMEANPGTFESVKFRGFRDAGVNRLSVGIQSFDDAMLKAIGRVHDAGEARRAVEIALATFDNVNLDLMYALPGQARAQSEADLREAIGFAPQHISAYHLTLEPNTVFHRYPPPLPDDDCAADMQETLEALLADAGYAHYETSAFARTGRRSRHNLNYWHFGDYLGIGAGAHAKISFADRITREVRHRQPKRYLDEALAGRALQETRVVGVGELPFEFMLNALRLVEGFPAKLFTERTGLPIAHVLAALERGEARGLVERDTLSIRPTARGRPTWKRQSRAWPGRYSPGNWSRSSRSWRRISSRSIR